MPDSLQAITSKPTGIHKPVFLEVVVVVVVVAVVVVVVVAVV